MAWSPPPKHRACSRPASSSTTPTAEAKTASLRTQKQARLHATTACYRARAHEGRGQVARRVRQNAGGRATATVTGRQLIDGHHDRGGAHPPSARGSTRCDAHVAALLDDTQIGPSELKCGWRYSAPAMREHSELVVGGGSSAVRLPSSIMSVDGFGGGALLAPTVSKCRARPPLCVGSVLQASKMEETRRGDLYYVLRYSRNAFSTERSW